jgi:NAD+ synthase
VQLAKGIIGIDVMVETRRITAFIRRMVKESSSKGVVVGLSGGVDSAVVGALCVRALGRGRVVGLLMPSGHTPKEDVADAEELADRWGIERVTVPISPVTGKVVSTLYGGADRIAKANVQARVRMVLLYYVANSRKLLVAGTGDRSESLLGFFTKFGDGGVDFLPIAHLYKTQVRALGRFLGLPEKVATKPASPQLWAGHTALEELPAGYDKLDIVLHQLFDLKSRPAEAARRAGVPKNVVTRVLEMHRLTEHKRNLPPSLSV